MVTRDRVSAHAAEARMLLDELTRRLRAEDPPSKAHPAALGPFVTISRQAGSGGSAIARRLSDDLGWSMLDRELVENLARALELDPRRLELVDETRTDWLRDTIFNLLDSRLVLQDSFVALLGRVMMLAARRGRVILVGRAGHLLLPDSGGLRVRIVAPRSWRVRRYAESEGLDEVAAAKRVDDLDAAREEFVRRHFRVGPADLPVFDLVLDAASLGEAGAASLIRRALEFKLGSE